MNGCKHCPFHVDWFRVHIVSLGVSLSDGGKETTNFKKSLWFLSSGAPHRGQWWQGSSSRCRKQLARDRILMVKDV